MIEEEDEKDPVRVFEVLKSWAESDNTFIETIKHPQLVRGMTILLSETSRASVVIPVQNKNTVEISTTLNVSPEHKQLLSELSNDDFEQFWFNLFETMVLLGADFISQKQGKEVNSIVILLRIVMEEFFIQESRVSKTLYYEKLDIIRRTTLYLINYINYAAGTYSKLLGLPEASDENGSDEI